MAFLESMKKFFVPTTKAFTAVLVGSIMAIEASGYRMVDNVLGSINWLGAPDHHVPRALQRHHRDWHRQQRSPQHIAVR